MKYRKEADTEIKIRKRKMGRGNQMSSPGVHASASSHYCRLSLLTKPFKDYKDSYSAKEREKYVILNDDL